MYMLLYSNLYSIIKCFACCINICVHGGFCFFRITAACIQCECINEYIFQIQTSLQIYFIGMISICLYD